MDTTYTKLDLGYLIDSDWSAIEDYFRIDDSGIWLLEESAPELRWLTQDERDLFMIHPDANPNFPVLPFPFTMKQFLKFADLPAIELHDFYLFADDTVDVVAIERLERMYAPSGALARALMFGELPKLAQLKEIQGEAASAYAAPVGAVGASGSVKPDKDEPAKPLQRTAAQDSAILCEIEKQGYDPLALPKNPPGKSGAKAAIRAALSKNSLFTGATVFDKAWERLTAHADISIQG